MKSDPTTIGRYQVVEKLASGGMGTVYLARDPVIERLVAIKLLREGFESSELRERFFREARSAGGLVHVNIVAIYDLGEHESQPYIAMEYVPGETIQNLIARRAEIPLVRKLQWLEEISAGLHYAHRSGIVHRDIKPGNLMIDAEGTAKILDFGIARVDDQSGSDTRPGTLIGTLNYMSPEQVTGQSNLNARADIFSFGAVAYELLSYQQAFPGGLPQALNAILQVMPPALAAIVPGIDPDLSAIVDRCLAKSPEDRYLGFEDVRTALAAVRSRLVGDSPEPAVSILPHVPSSRRHDPAYELQRRRREQVNSGLEQARVALAEAKIDRAIEAVEHALLLDPDNASALELLDDLHRRIPATPSPAPAPARPSAHGPETLQGTIIAPAPIPAVLPPPLSTPAVDATIIVSQPAASGAAPTPEVQLVVTRTSDPRGVGQTIRVDTFPFTIGRGHSCDFTLADETWSRLHAELTLVNDRFVLRDCDSSNGLYVNGRRIREGALLFGAVITIGKTDLVFSPVRETSLPDLTDCEVAARYRLVRLLRVSAKGAIYAAEDVRTSGAVAVKLLSPGLLQYPGYRDRFQHEAKIAVKLRHPHICSVIDYGVTTVQPRVGSNVTTQFVCFELMAGGNLAARMETGESIAPGHVEKWLTPIAEALDYAHRHDVLHGDLKPTAIIFDEDDHPYLTDFSIAQQALGAEARLVTGTPAYMAPEVWEDGTITPKADQFALAAIIYYTVTGSRPFEGQELPEVRRQNFKRGPIPAHEEAMHNGRSAIPRAVSQVLARGLAPHDSDRFESAGALALAFRNALRRIVPSIEGPQVFISYQRDTSTGLAMYLASKLKAEGIRPFVDAQGIDRAGRFPPQIEQAIEDADVFVCLLADKTLESSYVLDEIRAAVRFEKPMIPIMQESYDPAAQQSDPAVNTMLSFQGLPILDRRNLHLEHTAADLVRFVRSATGQRG
jgi:serine/threonine protein kinase